MIWLVKDSLYHQIKYFKVYIQKGLRFLDVKGISMGFMSVNLLRGKGMGKEDLPGIMERSLRVSGS